MHYQPSGSGYGAGTAATLALTLALAASCDAGEAGPAATVRDSAGVAIVESRRGSWGPGEEWWLSAEPVVQIGVADGPAEQQLFRAWSAVRLSDGRIVVANGGTAELRFYDEAGRHLASVGRSGAGPGEFEDLQRVWRLPGDTLLAYDFFPGRLSVFSPAGDFVRVRRYASPDGRQILIRGPLSDGSVIAAGAPIWNPPGATSGVVRDSVPYYRFDADGALAGTFGTFPSTETFRVVEPDRWWLTSLPFARSPRATVAGERFYFGPAESFEVRVFAVSGDLERIVRLDRPPRPVLPEEASRYRDDRLEAAEREGQGARAAEMRLLSQLPFPETLPPYDRLVVDVDGNLWVAEYRTDARDPATWQVFAATGELLGSMTTPARFEVAQIGRDFVLGAWRDDLDVEYIRMYALDRREGP